MRSLPLLLLAAVLLASSASAQTVQFYQTDFNFNGNLTSDSAWGTVELTYTGSAGELYLNLGVNGTWQVQDVPVLSIEGAGVLQTESFAFDLGVPDGVDVTGLDYGFTLTPAPTGVMPLSPTPATVAAEQMTVYASGDPSSFPVTAAPPVPNKGNGPAPVGLESAAHKDFPNQEAGPNECAPTAVSNSLKFLKSKHGLTMADADITIAKMKTACGWAPAGCPRDTWWSLKKAYMKANNLPIITKRVEKANIASIIKEIKDGQDVEAELFGHTVAVTGIKDLGGGKYKVTVAHDKNQDDNTKGTTTESSTYDSGTGTFTSGALSHYAGINYFVVECPKPKPAPATPSAPGSVTPTPPPGSSTVTPGTGTSVPPIPSDFFGPGSDPFDAPIPLEGVPFDPPNYGNGSVLWQFYGQPGLRDSDDGFDMEIDTEIIELDLVSIDPILVSYADGLVEEWDVRLNLYPFQDIWPGVVLTHRMHDNGGMFDGTVFVWPRLTFTRVGDGTEVIFDPLDHDPGAPPVELQFAGPWVYDVEPSLNLIAPNDGYFVWGVDQPAPGDPLSQIPHPVLLAAIDGAMQLELWSAEWMGTDTPPRVDPTLRARAYPNPFNPLVTIEYQMPAAGHLTIEIYTLRGELVRVLRNREVPEGIDHVVWDGTDASSRRVASGVYLYQISGAGQTVGEKITLVK